jgi:Caspase domain
MANQTCISIGINQYQFLPPIGYGRADAVAIEDFFVDAAGWDPSQCLLLTDTSSNHGDQSTYPDRANINRWLQQWSWDKLHHGDLLWLFFSGCGISFEGEDYLIPIDGNVTDLANTCISIRQLYQQLNEIGVNALVFIDANRSIHLPQSSGIGQVTAKLAQDYQIPTFLSCQSHEFSHEDAGLGHGLFTTALLEALNYHPDLNLGTIDSYLTSRLAELSEHHWKPLQTPVAIIPTTASVHRPVFSATTQSSISAMPEPAYTPPAPQSIRQEIYAPYTPPVPIMSADLMGTSAIVRRSQPVPRRNYLPHWASVSFILTVMVAAGGAVWMLTTQLPEVDKKPAPAVNNLSVPAPVPATESTQAVAPAPTRIAALARAKARIVSGDATSRLVAIKAARKIPATTPAAISEIKESIDLWSQEIAQIAEGYANKQEWQRAIDTAIMVPRDTTSYPAVQVAISQWRNKL